MPARKYFWIAKLQVDYKDEFYNLILGILQHFKLCGWLKIECRKNLYEDLRLLLYPLLHFGHNLISKMKIINSHL